jgi:hypothetical protein
MGDKVEDPQRSRETGHRTRPPSQSRRGSRLLRARNTFQLSCDRPCWRLPEVNLNRLWWPLLLSQGAVIDSLSVVGRVQGLMPGSVGKAIHEQIAWGVIGRNRVRGRDYNWRHCRWINIMGPRDRRRALFAELEGRRRRDCERGVLLMDATLGGRLHV